MNCSESQSFFEISSGPPLKNTVQGRLLCLKDFFKRCVVFPFALLVKAFKTFFRGFAVCIAALFIFMTVGSSARAREFFILRIASFAKDLADWLLLPFALIGCFFRLILALLIHPNFYFNAIV